MPVVFIPPLWQELTLGKESVTVAGRTVREAVENLERAIPGLRQRLIEGDRLRPNIRIAVDDRISALGLLERVSPKSEIHIIAAVGGG
jgi:molybdopterin converting factor small subunit